MEWPLHGYHFVVGLENGKQIFDTIMLEAILMSR